MSTSLCPRVTRPRKRSIAQPPQTYHSQRNSRSSAPTFSTSANDITQLGRTTSLNFGERHQLASCRLDFRGRPSTPVLINAGLLRSQNPAPQNFRDAPGLRDAAARRERRDGVEDLADRADARRVEVRDEAL